MDTPSGQPVAAHDQQAEASARWPWAQPLPKLLLAAAFGVAFGFLLQKGGVAKFDILIGVLLLEEFTVVKVMCTAILVGMLGVPLLQKAGLLQLQIKETVIGANIIGGLVFGYGFGLLAYCPGTNAAAIGQGNLDALTGAAGLMFGSYIFALMHRSTGRGLTTRGSLGKIQLHQLLRMPKALVIAVIAIMLIGVLALIEFVVEAPAG